MIGFWPKKYVPETAERKKTDMSENRNQISILRYNLARKTTPSDPRNCFSFPSRHWKSQKDFLFIRVSIGAQNQLQSLTEQKLHTLRKNLG